MSEDSTIIGDYRISNQCVMMEGGNTCQHLITDQVSNHSTMLGGPAIYGFLKSKGFSLAHFEKYAEENIIPKTTTAESHQNLNTM